MNTTVKRLRPQAFEPAEYIADETRERRWSVQQFGEKMGISRRQAQDLIDGTVRITPTIAIKLAKAFGSAATTWLRLQKSFDAASAK